ncbi:hypothetical protein MJO28_007985 [Puccinia striiformis f. sp. tritici]|uniref:Uncharacterized protein n=1 Tax=Puccinia striiformis f. sp. tritici TaxID=168172 RepID=A0ACC0E9M5_9BASI|nr:hypothetical protein Pst134EB_017020 [Puccinia striiformis f. sp. tritici]KAI7949164.1 hypothetical protein MJO28_007985 [Puccinia striiformis f. sp. tritici]
MSIRSLFVLLVCSIIQQTRALEYLKIVPHDQDKILIYHSATTPHHGSIIKSEITPGELHTALLEEEHGLRAIAFLDKSVEKKSKNPAPSLDDQMAQAIRRAVAKHLTRAQASELPSTAPNGVAEHSSSTSHDSPAAIRPSSAPDSSADEPPSPVPGTSSHEITPVDNDLPDPAPVEAQADEIKFSPTTLAMEYFGIVPDSEKIQLYRSDSVAHDEGPIKTSLGRLRTKPPVLQFLRIIPRENEIWLLHSATEPRRGKPAKTSITKVKPEDLYWILQEDGSHGHQAIELLAETARININKVNPSSIVEDQTDLQSVEALAFVECAGAFQSVDAELAHAFKTAARKHLNRLQAQNLSAHDSPAAGLSSQDTGAPAHHDPSTSASGDQSGVASDSADGDRDEPNRGSWRSKMFSRVSSRRASSSATGNDSPAAGLSSQDTGTPASHEPSASAPVDQSEEASSSAPASQPQVQPNQGSWRSKLFTRVSSRRASSLATDKDSPAAGLSSQDAGTPAHHEPSASASVDQSGAASNPADQDRVQPNRGSWFARFFSKQSSQPSSSSATGNQGQGEDQRAGFEKARWRAIYRTTNLLADALGQAPGVATPIIF